MFVPRSFGRFRKSRKTKPEGIATSGHSMVFGKFGLKAIESGKLNSKHLETSRRVISRVVKKSGRIWIRVFPHTPVTSKPSDVRMGNGKGSVDYWISNIYEGTVLFEIDGISKEDAEEVFRIVKSKLPIKCKVVYRKFIL